MNSEPSQSPSNSPRIWGVAFRPTLLFVVAFALNSTPHEAVHGITSCLLGYSATLFHMWVNPETAEATPRQLAIIAAAGPIFSLALGVTTGMLYQWRFKRRPSGLLFLMLAIVGIYSFLGPLAGSALGGDFNRALTSLEISKAVRTAASVMGFVLLPIFMFFMGRELVRWVPRDFGRAKAVVITTVAPWLIGSALVLLVYWPVPTFLVGPTLGGSAFWLFAGAGAAFGFRPARSSEFISSFSKVDLIATIVAVAMVRLLVNGVHMAC